MIGKSISHYHILEKLCQIDEADSEADAVLWTEGLMSRFRMDLLA